MVATDIWSTSSCSRRRTSAQTSTAVRSRTATASFTRSWRRLRPCSPPAELLCVCPRTASTVAWAARTMTRCSRMCSVACRSTDSPTWPCLTASASATRRRAAR
ncbi:hypothetical protein F441_22494 [Phytophthora nicotianae CJ01A1]|uniref:Uncharacterized protein n=1 Tax=Phytophthora nicotianae CJ01A1 TaxID=1317063 RepID=W2VPG9_PHYNI|nr:hypothetical protein F441_22494 [Phytophthora nicotianae CJ01A1]